jgi:tRNA A-37 threonylcarbamoyl transferase component Bud32
MVVKLCGHSGAEVELIDGRVHKSGRGVIRNYARMTSLGNLIPQPRIIDYSDSLVLEYIAGDNIADWLGNNQPHQLIKFIQSNIDILGEVIIDPYKDYLPVYEARLNSALYLPTTIGNIIDDLPRYLPQTQYHGDFTFDNIIAGSSGFVLIDAVDTDLDNIWFDLAKLRQDVDCGWFVRNRGGVTDDLAIKLRLISGELSRKYRHYSNRSMAILALGRVWNYSTPEEQEWISTKMDMLWRTPC